MNESEIVKATNPKDALGIKKVPVHCIPMEVMAELGLAMLEGARKYGSHNYRDAGVRASVYVDAVFRHLFLRWWEGEDLDPDSNLNHVTKAIACLVVMRDSMIKGNFVDDRPLQNEGIKFDELNDWAKKIVEMYPDCAEPFLRRVE
jgi:hypothetical protein